MPSGERAVPPKLIKYVPIGAITSLPATVKVVSGVLAERIIGIC